MSQPKSIARQAEDQVALEALQKQAQGGKLSRQDIAAIRRYEKRREDERRAQAYERCLGKDLCALVGIQRKQLTRYQSYGAPRNEDGTYNLFMFLPWLVEHQVAQVRKEQETAIDALEIQRRARASMLELSLQEKKGAVGPLEHFQQCVWDLFHNFARNLERWPRRVAKSREEEHRLTEEVRTLLAGYQAGVVVAAGKERADSEAKKTRKKSATAKKKRRKRSRSKSQ